MPRGLRKASNPTTYNKPQVLVHMAKGFSNPTNSPFRDKNGQWLTRALFLETRSANFEPMFTLKDDDFEGYPSLKKIYMAYSHVPGCEYDFANEHLGGWVHWCKVAGSQIGPHVAQWREELTIKLKADAMKNIILSSLGDGAVALQAAKYIDSSGYNMKRGRPSKLEKEAKLKQDTAINKEIEEDLKRLKLKAVK